MTPRSDNATGSELVTAPQTPGSDSADSASDNATGSARARGMQEMVPQPALLYNAINDLYICVGCCTLTLVVLLWGDFNQRMRIR